MKDSYFFPRQKITDEIYSESKFILIIYLESAPIKKHPIPVENLRSFGDISQQNEKSSCQTDINRLQKIAGIK